MALFVLAVAALGALASCSSGPLGIDVRDYRREPLALGPEGLPEPVAAACDAWGIECEGDQGGPVIVALVPDRSMQGLRALGWTMGAARCMYSFTAADLSVTHELGHALGLGHVGDPTNVMGDNGDPYGRVELTDAQLEAAHDRADELSRCPPLDGGP